MLVSTHRVVTHISVSGVPSRAPGAGDLPATISDWWGVGSWGSREWTIVTANDIVTVTRREKEDGSSSKH